MLSSQWRTPAVITLLVLVLLYAALLRLDALFKSYGPYTEPQWLASIQPFVASTAATITRDTRWPRLETPYVGSDAINYLKFAREMRSFYAAHAREPMFPAATRIGLMLTGDADVGISVVSIAFGVLTLIAVWALGTVMASRLAGVAAAAMLGIDHIAVIHAIEGWRDEAFAFFAISCAWAWIRFARRPTTANAVLAGALSGGACLTRITSISFIAPAVLWLLATRGTAIRRELTIAVGVMAILVAPFLINCAIATGDPLYAINNHTEFFLRREGASDTRPISAVRYSLEKFEARPIAATDNALLGLFAYPFNNKWAGLDSWVPGLGTTLSYFAIGGLFAWLWSPEGRLLLVMLFGALVPFCMTWTVRGGAEWRFTLFAYAFYLVAAFWLVDKAAKWARSRIVARDTRSRTQVTRRQILRTASVVLALVVVAAVWWVGAPYAILRESLALDGGATIMAGPRDRWFFVDGWSGLVTQGNVTLRSTVEPAAALRIVLPEPRSYGLTLRMDPVNPSAAPRQIVHLSMNGKPLDAMVLGWNPERVGQFDVSIPAGTFAPGTQRLELRSDTPFKLWYVHTVAQ